MKFLSLFLMLLLSLCALAGLAETNAVLPSGYETGSLRYPVLCLLPEKPGEPVTAEVLAAFQAAMTESSFDMIILTPALPDGDVSDTIRDCFLEADRNYRTIPSPDARFLAGCGYGGYLAYAAALRDPSRFGGVASINGNFAAEGSPWHASLGSVMEQLEKVHQDSPDDLRRLFTYLDAPAGAPEAELPGSTNALGRKMISYRLPASIHEFTLRPGTMTAAFLQESASRYIGCLTGLLRRKILQGSIFPSIAQEGTDRSVTVTAQIQLLQGLPEADLAAWPLEAVLELTDSRSGQVTEKRLPVQPDESGYFSFAAELTEKDLLPESDQIMARLSFCLPGKQFPLSEQTLSLPVPAQSEEGILSLEGNWSFNYTGMTQLPMEQIQPDLFRSWSVVQPGIGNWTEGYGNISAENVRVNAQSDNFDFFITGNAYYARTFDLPASFTADSFVLSIGYVDDRCEVWLNGVRVGETGMQEGRSNGQSTWADYSAFPVDSALLRQADNTLVVRCFNDLPFGAGGWYGGPVALYTAEAFAKAHESETDPRFFEITFPSQNAAQGSGMSETEVPCLIYLPPSYFSERRHYPTVYLLHQFNSDHTSYRQDHVKEMLDSGIASGTLDEMIVIIPKSHPNSWWRDQWEKMVTEELIPYIDRHYRTIQDSRWRLTAGCSMGGQGAFGIALRHPDLFTGAVSFFGAFSYGGDANPNLIANRESADYLNSFTLAFICGNQDDYGFGMPALDLHHLLSTKQVPHLFFIENGGHNSQFYTPYFVDTLAYVRQNMDRSDLVREDWFKAGISGKDPALLLDVSKEASVLLRRIPESSYTRDPNPPLLCTVNLIEHGGEGESCLLSIPDVRLIPGETTTVPLPDSLAGKDPDTVSAEIALFDLLLHPSQISE